MKLEILNYFNLLKFIYQQFYVTNTRMCREGPWCTCKFWVLCLTRGSWRNHISSIMAILPFNRYGGVFLSWNKWVWFIFPWTSSAGKPIIFLMSQPSTSTKVANTKNTDFNLQKLPDSPINKTHSHTALHGFSYLPPWIRLQLPTTFVWTSLLLLTLAVYWKIKN